MTDTLPSLGTTLLMDDDYPTCADTYATFRTYHETDRPETVSTTLGLEPSSRQQVGMPYEKRGGQETYRLSGWFLCSEKHVQSYDAIKHLDWLLDQLKPRQSALDTLRRQGWRMDIACLWDSQEGHGGPTLPPALLKRLGDLGVELWFDVYFVGATFALRRMKKSDGLDAKAF